MISSKINVVLTFFCLIAYSSCSGAFENYDQKLYKISKENPSFSGFHIDESGNSVLLLSNSSLTNENGILSIKDNIEFKRIIGNDFANDLEEFYGPHRFFNLNRIKDLKKIENRNENELNLNII